MPVPVMYNFAAFKISTRAATVLFFRVFQLCFFAKNRRTAVPFRGAVRQFLFWDHFMTFTVNFTRVGFTFSAQFSGVISN